jgi:exopolyphosphatase/pppGpp-phosphohydrolase
MENDSEINFALQSSNVQSIVNAVQKRYKHDKYVIEIFTKKQVLQLICKESFVWRANLVCANPRRKAYICAANLVPITVIECLQSPQTAIHQALAVIHAP